MPYKKYILGECVNRSRIIYIMLNLGWCYERCAVVKNVE